MADLTIREATSRDDFDQFDKLCRQYVEWCGERYRDIPGLVKDIFGYQSLDEELTLLATKYASPCGRAILIQQSGETIGAGAYRRTSDTVCEMKRVYIVDHAKGQGVGRRLVEALLHAAQAEGFAVMQLDTGKRFTEAIALYTHLGFVRCEPFHDYPEELKPYMVFMKKDLACPFSKSEG